MSLRESHQRELIAARDSTPIAVAAPRTFRRWMTLSLGTIFVLCLGIWFVPIAWQAFCEQRFRDAIYWEHWADADTWRQRQQRFRNAQNSLDDVNQARLQRSQGQIKEARESLLRASRRGHSPAKLQREEWILEAQGGDLSTAEEPLLTDLENASDSSVVFAALAEGYLRSGQFAKGELLLTQWLQVEPQNWKAHFLQAQFFALMERWGPAVEEFRTALRFHPGHAESEFHLAEALLNLRDALSALPLLCRSVTRWPDRPLVAVAFGRALTETGDPSAAVAALEEWSRRQPQSTTISVALGEALLACGRLEEVIVLHQTKARQGCADPELRFQLGTALQRLKRHADAKPHLEFSLHARQELDAVVRLRGDARQRPGATATQLKLAELLLKYEQEPEAFLWLRGILAREPRHRGAHQLIADYYQRTAAWDESRRRLEAEHRQVVE